MIQLCRANIAENSTQGRAIGEIAMVEKQASTVNFFIAPQMLDARSQQIASAPHDAVHRVPLFQKQLAQIGAVLTGDSGNQRDFVRIVHTSRVSLATFALCFLERSGGRAFPYPADQPRQLKSAYQARNEKRSAAQAVAKVSRDKIGSPNRESRRGRRDESERLANTMDRRRQQRDLLE